MNATTTTMKTTPTSRPVDVRQPPGGRPHGKVSARLSVLIVAGLGLGLGLGCSSKDATEAAPRSRSLKADEAERAPEAKMEDRKEYQARPASTPAPEPVFEPESPGDPAASQRGFGGAGVGKGSAGGEVRRRRAKKRPPRSARKPAPFPSRDVSKAEPKAKPRPSKPRAQNRRPNTSFDDAADQGALERLGEADKKSKADKVPTFKAGLVTGTAPVDGKDVLAQDMEKSPASGKKAKRRSSHLNDKVAMGEEGRFGYLASDTSTLLKEGANVDRLDVADLPVEPVTEEAAQHEGEAGDGAMLDNDQAVLADLTHQVDQPKSIVAPAQGWVAERYLRPETFLPRMFYFDPTYLGGNAATAERQRRLRQALPSNPFPDAKVYDQDFDAPDDAGMALSVRLDRNHLDRPGRVFLEVGLQGSKRYGWRRPPLDMVVVVDAPAWRQHRAKVEAALEQLMRRLGPQDRLGVAVAGLARPMVQPLARLRALRRELPESLDRAATEAAGTGDVTATMNLAAERLAEVALQEATIPGTQTVLLLAGATDSASARAAERAAHQLTSARAVFTSVVQMTSSPAPWWDVAAKGYGNFHRLQGSTVAAVVEAELSSLSRVVARLLRVNVRLGPNTKAIRVVGTRKLDDEEVRQVKAREVAIDTQLSKAQGVTADRGEDDDGVQTVIPYFYGGDAHVIVLELWVDKAGPVADVTVKYKDMVKLDNATARASVGIGSTPQAMTPGQRAVIKNLRGAKIAEALKTAASQVRQGATERALTTLRGALGLVPDGEDAERRMLHRFIASLSQPTSHQQRLLLSQALQMAGERKLGISVAGAR